MMPVSTRKLWRRAQVIAAALLLSSAAHADFGTYVDHKVRGQTLTVTTTDGALSDTDNVAITVDLITPIAMDQGLRFAIREGGRTVGAGVVAEIIE